MRAITCLWVCMAHLIACHENVLQMTLEHIRDNSYKEQRNSQTALALLLCRADSAAAWRIANNGHSTALGIHRIRHSGSGFAVPQKCKKDLYTKTPFLLPSLSSAARHALAIAKEPVELEPDWTQFVTETEEDWAVAWDEDMEFKVPKAMSTARRRRTRDRKPVKRAFVKEAISRVGCYGCGADLQFEVPSAAGYVDPERYDVKERYKQLRQLLCNRCRAMSNGEILPAVVEGRLRSVDEGEGGANMNLGAGVATPDQLREELKPLRQQKVLAVLLVDVTDVTGSFLPRIRDLIGSNPITLIGTKVDLLPKGTSHEQTLAWLVDAISPFVMIIDAFLVSGKTDEGMKNATSSILRDRSGRDVFVLGAANCGKSMFIGSFLAHTRDGRIKRLPISSSTPGTTLRRIPINVFDGKAMLFDTPGIHLSHRLSAQLLPEELKSMIPRRKIRPHTPGIGSGIEGCSFFWGGLVRLDVLEAPANARLTFISAAGNLLVNKFEGGFEHAAAHYAAEVGRSLTPPLTPESAEDLGELVKSKRVEVDLYSERQAVDISISGLGWISVGAVASLRKGYVMKAVIDVWAPREVKVSTRSPMPVSGLPNQVIYEMEPREEEMA